MKGNFFVAAMYLTVLPCDAGKTESISPGFGYPGVVTPYQGASELAVSMSRFGMTAEWFRRSDLPDDYMRIQRPQVNELPVGCEHFPDKCTYETPTATVWRGPDR